MMDYVWLALAGVVIGAIAKLIIPGEQPGGIFVTMLFGVLGAYVGNFLRDMITGDSHAIFEVTDVMSWVWAVVGSLIVILIWVKLIGPMLNKAKQSTDS